MLKKLLCNLLGHKWLYNFPSLANRAICKRCNKKYEFDFQTHEWVERETFAPNLGTDEEIKKRWFNYGH